MMIAYGIIVDYGKETKYQNISSQSNQITVRIAGNELWECVRDIKRGLYSITEVNKVINFLRSEKIIEGYNKVMLDEFEYGINHIVKKK